MNLVWTWLRRVPTAIAALFLVVGLGGLIAMYGAAPTFRAALPANTIQKLDGNAYTAPVAASISGPMAQVFQLRSDADDATTSSYLKVLENGRELGPAHIKLDDIALLGGGSFRHEKGRVLFSTPDNSDPRANGRAYAVASVLEPRLKLVVPALLLLIIGVARLAPPLSSWARSTARRVGWPAPAACIAFGLAACYSPVDRLLEPPVRLTGLLLLAGGVLWLFFGAGLQREAILSRAFDGGVFRSSSRRTPLIWMTAGGAVAVALVLLLQGPLITPPTSLGLLSYFPVSDASGYWDCANQLIDDHTVQHWCQRRPLYSMFASGLAIVADRNLGGVLLLQAGLVGAFTSLFARELGRWLGAAACVIAILSVGLYAWQFVLGQTVSEVGGLLFGLSSGALLLRAAEARSVILAASGAFLFALGEVMRPGALFVLPLLVLWAGLARGAGVRRFLVGAGLAGAGIVLAYACGMAAIMLVGGDPALANSNFPQTLYGLAVGKDWGSLGLQHPELLAETRENVQRITTLAVDIIQRNPGVFLKSLTTNFFTYINSPWYLALIPLRPAGGCLLLSLGVVGYCIRRSPGAMLIFCFGLGELASAPFLAGDGNIRVWAASAPLGQAAVFGFFLTFIARSLLRLSIAVPQAAPPLEAGGSRFLLVAGAFLSAWLVLPFSPARALVDAEPSAGAATCPAGQAPIAINLSAAAWMEITSGDSDRTSAPRHISHEDLLSRTPPETWFASSVYALSDVQLLRAVEIGPGLGNPVALYASSDLQLPRSGLALTCVDQNRTITVASEKFRQIISATSTAR